MRAGFNHHFVSLGGDVNPTRYPLGRAGLRPDNYWNTGIEPTASTQYGGQTAIPAPGIWHFYTYWPEMRSWQSPSGVATNDNGTAYYGNSFEPKTPTPVPRGQWISVEIMVKMNDVGDSRRNNGLKEA